MQTIREMLEEREKTFLSSKATLSANSLGREIEEEPCDIRLCFQRDRDRIIHCKSFRRLKHKTQVFLSPESDHYRTRLTHTLEVAQIARTISRALSLNEDLTEAIALGHDLGHTPFGHAGERALRTCLDGNFTHYEQSVRVCKKLEKQPRGLNLTYEVLDGILNHTKGDWPKTIEGKVVRFSDRIAYINHDIDDAIRGKIITLDDLPKEVVDYLGDTTTKRINKLVLSVINNSDDDIKMDEETFGYYDMLHNYLYANVYLGSDAKIEERKVDGFICAIFEHLLKNPNEIPTEYHTIIEQEGVARAAADYIAGMTDHYALSVFSNIYIPKAWNH